MTENTHKIFVTTGASNHAQNDRASYDFYCTDPKALEMLLERVMTFTPQIQKP